MRYCRPGSILKFCKNVCRKLGWTSASVLAWMTSVILVPTICAFGADTGSIAKALQMLPRKTTATGTTVIDGRLYGGNLHAEFSGDVNDSSTWTNIVFSLKSNKDATKAVDCGVSATRAILDGCVLERSTDVLNILFPASLSESLTGRDAAQAHAEMFLVTTALGSVAPSNNEGRRRTDIGGMVEHEWFSGGHAWQGLYQLNSIPLSFHGRYARLNDSVSTDSVSTSSVTVSADFHPSFRLKAPVAWRAGFDARTNLLYSHLSSQQAQLSSTLNLGTFDFGGGAWTSVQKDFSRVRVGAGSLFQTSKSYVPTSLVEKEQFIANAVNDRPLDLDLAYGGLVGFATSDRTSINGRFIETRPIASDLQRTPTRLAMVSFGYLFGGATPIDFGYKISKSNLFTAHSVFVQGNFRW